jgi:hypothetical protein
MKKAEIEQVVIQIKMGIEQNLINQKYGELLLIDLEEQLTLTDVVSTLKDKDVLTFEEWVKHNYRAGKHNYYSLNGMNCLSYEEVLQKYSVYKQNL